VVSGYSRNDSHRGWRTDQGLSQTRLVTRPRRSRPTSVITRPSRAPAMCRSCRLGHVRTQRLSKGLSGSDTHRLSRLIRHRRGRYCGADRLRVVSVCLRPRDHTPSERPRVYRPGPSGRGARRKAVPKGYRRDFVGLSDILVNNRWTERETTPVPRWPASRGTAPGDNVAMRAQH
jgi:hypothetical protein